jgi:hypothetical protein
MLCIREDVCLHVVRRLDCLSCHVISRQSLGQLVLPSLVQHRPKLPVWLGQAMLQFLHLHLQDTFSQVGNISLMKQQFLITHTICQAQIPALLDRYVKNTRSVKVWCPQKKCVSLCFCKNIACLHVSLLRIFQVFSFSPIRLCFGGYDKLLFHEQFVFDGLLAVADVCWDLEWVGIAWWWYWRDCKTGMSFILLSSSLPLN